MEGDCRDDGGERKEGEGRRRQRKERRHSCIEGYTGILTATVHVGQFSVTIQHSKQMQFLNSVSLGFKVRS